MAPERKQVKKFLKPKADIGGEEAPKKSGWMGYALILGVVATVVIAVYAMPYQSAPVTVSVARSAPTVPNQSADKSPIDRRVPDPAPAKKAEVPSYEEYVKQAKANKWVPSDPIQKLESSILRHKQVLYGNCDALVLSLFTICCLLLYFFSTRSSMYSHSPAQTTPCSSSA